MTGHTELPHQFCCGGQVDFCSEKLDSWQARGVALALGRFESNLHLDTPKVPKPIQTHLYNNKILQSCFAQHCLFMAHMVVIHEGLRGWGLRGLVDCVGQNSAMSLKRFTEALGLQTVFLVRTTTVSINYSAANIWCPRTLTTPQLKLNSCAMTFSGGWSTKGNHILRWPWLSDAADIAVFGFSFVCFLIEI